MKYFYCETQYRDHRVCPKAFGDRQWPLQTGLLIWNKSWFQFQPTTEEVLNVWSGSAACSLFYHPTTRQTQEKPEQLPCNSQIEALLSLHVKQNEIWFGSNLIHLATLLIYQTALWCWLTVQAISQSKNGGKKKSLHQVP